MVKMSKNYKEYTETELNKLTEEEFLKVYQTKEKDKYEKPSVTVDMVMFGSGYKQVDERKRKHRTLDLLLIKRGGHPYQGKWALLGGFMNIDESLEDAVKRELEEETGIKNVYSEQLYTWSDVNRDPRMRIVSASYMALVDRKEMQVKAGDDAVDAKWFTVDVKVASKNTEKSKDGKVKDTERLVLQFTSGDVQDVFLALVDVVTTIDGTLTNQEINIVDNGELAFDHAKIITYALKRLQGKVSYTNIAFNLVGKEFPLHELKDLYEIMLGKKLQKVTFNRHVEKMVIDLDKTDNDSRYRPAKLYKYNPLWTIGL